MDIDTETDMLVDPENYFSGNFDISDSQVKNATVSNIGQDSLETHQEHRPATLSADRVQLGEISGSSEELGAKINCFHPTNRQSCL